MSPTMHRPRSAAAAAVVAMACLLAGAGADAAAFAAAFDRASRRATSAAAVVVPSASLSASSLSEPYSPGGAAVVVAERENADRRGGGEEAKPPVEVDFDWRPVAESVFCGEDQRPVVLFDGLCNLCNGGVNFALDHDSVGNLRFASLQSRVGRSLLLRSGRRPDDTSSIVLVDPDGAHFGSDAVMRISRGLDGPFLPLVGVVGPLLPPFVRDRMYEFVAENRYRFGEADQCRLYDDRFDDRFIPDPDPMD